jgi:hypothetical protein
MVKVINSRASLSDNSETEGRLTISERGYPSFSSFISESKVWLPRNVRKEFREESEKKHIEDLIIKYDNEPLKPETIKTLTRKCLVCGRVFATNYDGDRPLCSKECAKKWLEQHSKVCEICGKSFVVKGLAGYARAKFCSIRCGRISNGNSRTPNNCEGCGRELITKEEYRRGFHSDECYAQYLKKLRNKFQKEFS